MYSFPHLLLLTLLLYPPLFSAIHNFTTHSVLTTVDTENGRSRCNIFKGRWVYSQDFFTYDSSCPFITPQFNCILNGRHDSKFLHYRWQPSSCNLNKFNGLEFVKKWQGKKIMFVGDSISSNQWQSLLCMIHASITFSKYTIYRAGSLSSVIFEGYNVSISYYRTEFLVDMDEEAGNVTVLKLDSISGRRVWRDNDCLIFNSWHWWTHTGKYQPWNYIEVNKTRHGDMNRLVAFYQGMTTWGRWVNRNVDFKKTRVFFSGISPTHYRGIDWGKANNSCHGQVEPFKGSRYPAGIPEASAVVERVFRRLNKAVVLLDITALSLFRKDAHPADDGVGMDCSHWCLPGLPDTWNLLLITALSS